MTHMLFNIRLSERMLDCLLSFRIASLSIYRICTCIACIAPLNSVSRRICCNLPPLPYVSYAKAVYVTPKEMCLLGFYGLRFLAFVPPQQLYLMASSVSFFDPQPYHAGTCGYCSPPGQRSASKSSLSIGAVAYVLTCEVSANVCLLKSSAHSFE